MFSIALIGVVFLLTLLFSNVIARDDRTLKPLVLPVKIGALIAILILAVLSTITMVPAGHRGVVTVFGKVTPSVLPEGINFVHPLSSITDMSARVEKDVEEQSAETSDTQSVSVTVITNWQPVADSLATLYKDYGLEYDKKIIPPAIKEAVKAEVAKYKVTELIAKRPELHRGIQESVNTWLNKYNLKVLEVTIADIDFSEKYDAAIEAKQVQEQQALQKKYELDRTVTEAQMAAAQAKGESDSKIARATGEAESLKLQAAAEAEALRIRGQAQADYNQKVAESLNSNLIQYEWLKRWDGKLPVYTLGDSSPMIMLKP